MHPVHAAAATTDDNVVAQRRVERVVAEASEALADMATHGAQSNTTLGSAGLSVNALEAEDQPVSQALMQTPAARVKVAGFIPVCIAEGSTCVLTLQCTVDGDTAAAAAGADDSPALCRVVVFGVGAAIINAEHRLHSGVSELT